MATLRYDIDVDDRNASRRIGAFALNMRRTIVQAVRSLPEIEINASSTDAQREVAEVRRSLVELGNQRIDIDISAEEAQRRLTALTERLQALRGASGDIRIDADVDAALRDLGIVDAAVDRLDGRRATVHVDVDKSFSDTIIKIAALGRALGTLAVPAAVLNLIPLIAGIAASIADLSGAAGLLPAIMISAGMAFAAAKVGLSGFGQAMKDIGDPKKFAEDVADLAPAARDVAVAVRDLGPAWRDVRLDVQQKLFAGMKDEINGLAAAALPTLQFGLRGIATELNLGARSFTEWLRSAQTTRDVGVIFEATRQTMHELIPAGRNVAAAFLDIGVVGSKFLPELAAHVTGLTSRFREFIAQARESGQLEQWIQNGIDKVNQLGRVFGNVGGALGAFFSAANASGSDFLDLAERISAELETLLKTPTAQAGITAVFREIGAAVDAALPGVREFATGLFRMFEAAANTGGLRAVGQALSDILSAVTPLLPALGQLAGETLRGLASTAASVAPLVRDIAGFLVDMLEALGPIGPAVVGMVAAFRLMSPITGLVTSLGASLAGLVTRLGGSEAAAGRVAAGFAAVGRALPLVGAAVVGLGILFDQVGPKADKAAQTVINGSRTMAQAISDEAERNLARIITWDAAAAKQEAYANAARTVTEEFHRLYDAMSPMEKLEADVAIAQAYLNDQIIQFTPNSAQARNAAASLSDAQARLKAVQDAAAASTRTLGDEIVATSEKMAGAANADIAYERSLAALADAHDRVAEATRTSGAGSKEYERALLDERAAALSVAEAAKQKAIADAEATGATNAAEIGAAVYNDTLRVLAGQASGPTRDALLKYADSSSTSASAAATAENAAKLHKEELLRLTSTVSGPLTEGLAAARRAVDLFGVGHSDAEVKARQHKDELNRLLGLANGPFNAAMGAAKRATDIFGDSHTIAEGKARAQKDELGRLAAIADGVVRSALGRMSDAIRNIPDKTATVTLNGRLGAISGVFSGVAEAAGAIVAGANRRTGGLVPTPGGRRWSAFADGGITQGYTPGRDVHRFWAANGNVLDLSGGEAIMRPEWTQAMGPAYVHSANDAARQGGVAGVSSFLARTLARGKSEGKAGDGSKFANGGIWGSSFAGGGMFLGGEQPLESMVPKVYNSLSGPVLAKMRDTLIAQVESAIKAAVAAMAAAGGGPTTAGATAGLNWARTQVGKPYIWGGVGPVGYDCSGFISAVVNVMRGRNPYSRVGATGNFPWAGFAPGFGAGLNVGAFRGDPGHMAGTIGGTNLESSGSVGVRVGGGARGAGNSMFNIRAHLADQGRMIRSGEAGINLSGMPERMLSPGETRNYAGDGSGQVVDQIAALRSDMRTLGESIRARQGHVFNVHGQDMQESVHASRMLIRTLR